MKMKSAFENMYHSWVQNNSISIIGGNDGKKQLVLGAPIYHGWYDRAQVGMHHRMEDKVVKDYGLSREAVVALQVILEREWELASLDVDNRMEVVQLACFLGGIRASFEER
jgi:hypothetical protein